MTADAFGPRAAVPRPHGRALHEVARNPNVAGEAQDEIVAAGAQATRNMADNLTAVRLPVHL